jgi:hypothetical protein
LISIVFLAALHWISDGRCLKSLWDSERSEESLILRVLGGFLTLKNVAETALSVSVQQNEKGRCGDLEERIRVGDELINLGEILRIKLSKGLGDFGCP